MNQGMLELIKQMSEVGFTLVCAGLVIIYVVWNTKKQEKRDKARDDMLTGLIDTLVNERKKENDYNPSVDRTSEHISNRVYEIIVKLREMTEASRASFISYHNGTRDLLGSHFTQMSCRVESVVNGISPLQLTMQSIPRSFLLNWCSLIRERKEEAIGWLDIEEIRETEFQLYDFFTSRGTKGVLGKAVLDENSHVRGFILLEFTYKPSGEVFEKSKELMHDKSIKVSEQLILLDKEQEKCSGYINLIEKE